MELNSDRCERQTNRANKIYTSTSPLYEVAIDPTGGV